MNINVMKLPSLIILLVINFFQSEGLGHSQDYKLLQKAAKFYKSINSSPFIANIGRSNTKSADSYNLNIQKLFHFQNLNLSEANVLSCYFERKSDTGTANKTIFSQRLKYETSKLNPAEISKNTYLIPSKLSICERLLVQSAKISYSANRHNIKNKRQSRTFVNNMNDLNYAVKSSISNIPQTSVEKPVSHFPKKTSPDSEFKYFEKSNSIKSNTSEEVLKLIFRNLRNEFDTSETRNQKLIPTSIVVPVPPNQKEVSFNQINELVLSHEQENGNKNVFQNLHIPNLLEISNKDIETTDSRTNRSLPPGAEFELKEFFERQANKNNCSTIKCNVKSSMKNEKSNSQKFNPFKPSD